MRDSIYISVRPLVKYMHRSGSIHSGFRSNSSMVEGTRVHQVVQKGYKEHERKEVYLRTEISYQDVLFVVEGRCDGFIELDGVWTVDEIKSISLPLEEIQGNGQPVHWKTISTLFPAIKAIGEGLVSQVYYVTARTTTRAAAEEAYAHMQAQGLHMHVATLTAKDKICFKDENDCDAGACSLCEGYYD